MNFIRFLITETYLHLTKEYVNYEFLSSLFELLVTQSYLQAEKDAFYRWLNELVQFSMKNAPEDNN